VDLAVAEGDTVALLGPSGAGKSTLLWLLAGLLRPTAGLVEVCGRRVGDLTGRSAADMRLRDVGVVLQNPGRNLLHNETALGNVLFAQGPTRRSRAVKRRRAAGLLDAVGLGPATRRTAGRLSGGEQQRLALAVALANGPRLLLADEPTSQLDHETAGAVVGLIRAANEDLGTTVVVVTHDPDVGSALGRTVTIRDGRRGPRGTRVRTTWWSPAMARCSCRMRSCAVRCRPGRWPARWRPRTAWNCGGSTWSGTPVVTGPAGDGADMLDARGLRYVRDGQTILAGVDVTVDPGQSLAVTGPSGSGKSSLLAVIAGLARPEAGEVYLDGAPLTGFAGPATGVAVVLQGYGLVSLLTAAENIEVALRAAGRPAAAAPGLARASLADLGLEAHADQLVEELSGGQQQRVAVARALALKPKLLIADEPTAELDPAARAVVLARIFNVVTGGGALVVATHDPEVAARCDRVLDLHAT
jgi:putative ABC transport system ATP-binding protein